MKRMLRGLLCLALSLNAALAVAAGAPVFETRLDNGLKVLVMEDRRAPTAVQMVWYRVGSVDEVNGTTGLAHALEHMMFKGTPKVGVGGFSKRVAAAGGRENAFTNRDYTAYFQQIPKERLHEMMVLEADRMRHLSLAPAEFAKEIQVVMEERRLRTEDQPGSLLYEGLNAAAFQASPYRVPVIGWMDDLKHMTVADLRAFYDRWYVPNNATLVVVGDVDHQQVFRWAKETYGPLKARPLPVRKPQDEPVQTGIRRVTVKAPAELPSVMLAWKAPKVTGMDAKAQAQDGDTYALDVLAALLDGYDGARLTTRLVKEARIAQDVGVGYDNVGRGPALFMVQATPAPGKTPAEVEAAVRAEIARIATEGVKDEELVRARAQMLASQIYKRDSMFAQAMEMGELETVGLGWQASDRMIERLKAVTAADVVRVAKTYFGDDTLTVGVLDPQPLKDRPAAKARGDAVPAAGLRH
ncbi:zinc protease [Oryzomicrobium terrae]|uniref:Zinc protease n=1 Tax=Oryzomicrobium terrae TaxID=1735038 RepID=A0A5C1E4M5_9RHOO|nr:pitrilysin family protein [Oryzomicrobium terrae]QEL63876.1 zinc protease [Oryzomicrobium terrae]